MYKESLILVACAVAAANGLYSGFGGVVGNLTPRTGSSWPPYPGAGRGYWANRAGFYDSGRSGFDHGNSRYFANRRPKRSPLYAGFGGVVGELTPRTGGGYSGGSSGKVQYSEYNRSRYAAARKATNYSGKSSSRKSNNNRKSYRSRYSYYRGSGFTGYRGFRG